MRGFTIVLIFGLLLSIPHCGPGAGTLALVEPPPLEKAFCAGDREAAKRLLAQSAPGHAELHGLAATAIVCKQRPMADLLPNGQKIMADVDLLYACDEEKPEARALKALEAGGDPNQLSSIKENPFFKKNCYRSEKLVRTAVKFGLRLDQRNTANKTILHVAAEDGDLAAVKVLLRCGAKPDSTLVVFTYKDRSVETTETRTYYTPTGNRNYKTTHKGERTIRDRFEIPLEQYAREHDPELYRMLSSSRRK